MGAYGTQDTDFFSEGTTDPFTGLAPAEDPAEVENARKARLREAAQANANINNRPGGVNQFAGNSQTIDPKTGKPYTGRERAKPGSFTSGILPTLKAISKDPVTMGILAAPYAVLGAGAAFGGLAAGGEGTLVGSSAPGMAYAGADTAGAEATMNAAATANATVPAVHPVGYAAAQTAATAAPAAAPWGAAGFAKDIGIPTALALAPWAIDKLAGGRTKEEKALIAKQEQLAAEAKVRTGQQQDARMNQLGQQLLAFNPSNQLMAQMYGPQAAFTPEQAATMVQGQAPALDEKWSNYSGDDKKTWADIHEYNRRKKEYEAAEAARRDMMMSGIQQPGPGPTPIQMSAPQAARKY